MHLEQRNVGFIRGQRVLALPTSVLNAQGNCDYAFNGKRLREQSPEQFQNEIALIEKYPPLPTKASLR